MHFTLYDFPGIIGSLFFKGPKNEDGELGLVLFMIFPVLQVWFSFSGIRVRGPQELIPIPIWGARLRISISSAKYQEHTHLVISAVGLWAVA
jgi:hypothetical protein